MKKLKKSAKLLMITLSMIAVLNENSSAQKLIVEIYETAANGNSLKKIVKPFKDQKM